MISLIFRVLLDAAIIVFLLTVLCCWRALRPGRMPVSLRPKDLGLPGEEIQLLTEDGKRLAGWFIPAEKPAGVVVCLHGYPANKSDILLEVSFLYPHFSLLLFDFRGHGESGGRITYFGLKETADVRAALNYLQKDKRSQSLPVAVWGYSLGAAVAILTAARDRRIKAVVSDSAFASFPEMVGHYYRSLGPLKYLLAPLSRLLGRIFLKADFDENSPERVIGQLHCPVLIIHSREDEYVPAEHALRLYRQAPEPKALYWKSGSHAGLRAEAGSYQAKVLSFLKETLGKNKGGEDSDRS
ncbi:MAG TPA: alpha/beta fold hydrolase [bacterium]|nr:alpha/beta fold hydrolase [bacterium]HPP13009.1 alpha/beta fold hydrolase [bacterium]